MYREEDVKLLVGASSSTMSETLACVGRFMLMRPEEKVGLDAFLCRQSCGSSVTIREGVAQWNDINVLASVASLLECNGNEAKIRTTNLTS